MVIPKLDYLRWVDFKHFIKGNDDGEDRQTTSTADGDTDDPSDPGDDGANAPTISPGQTITFSTLLPGNIAWINTSTSGTILTWPEPTIDPEITVESTGIEVGEIIAWRAWRIKDGILTSLVMDTPWLPNETVEGSIKGYGGYGIPLGIYSFKKASDAWNGVQYTTDEEIIVAGQVALWGEVIEHEEGYRAENARVHSLDFIRPETPENETVLAKLQQRYGLA